MQDESTPQPVQERGSRLRMITDASYRDGIAGIAVVGDLGEHVEVVPARHSRHAEEMALLLAMGLVYRHGIFHCPKIPRAEFFTDYNPVTQTDRVKRYLATYGQWRLVASTRDVTKPADRLAGRARRAQEAIRMTELGDRERDFLRDVLAGWVSEGFTVPPYPPEFYDVAEKLGLRQEDVADYDITRPTDA